MIEDSQLRVLIRWHLENHESLDIQDVYKMLYQGIMGAEHLIHNVERTKEFLIQEWGGVTPVSARLLHGIIERLLELDLAPQQWQRLLDEFDSAGAAIPPSELEISRLCEMESGLTSQ